MKIVIAALAILLLHPIVIAQKKEMREKALREIDSLISNPFEFLGKTDSLIMAAGRPSSIIGGDQWETEVSEATKQDAGDIGKMMVIGTGCGALLLTISTKSKLVYSILYLPHKKARLGATDIWEHLNGTYEFDPDFTSMIQTRDSSWIQLAVLRGTIMIMALKSNKKGVRFEN